MNKRLVLFSIFLSGIFIANIQTRKEQYPSWNIMGDFIMTRDTSQVNEEKRDSIFV